MRERKGTCLYSGHGIRPFRFWDGRHDYTFETTFTIANPLVCEKLGGMSKTTVGAASIAVTLLLTVASTIAPGIPDEHRMKAFIATLILLVIACLWWVWARFFARASPQPAAPQEAVRATNVSGNVAAAGRDVHQTIYHHPPPPTEPTPPSVKLPEFCFQPHHGSKIEFNFRIDPKINKPFAVVDLILRFDNRGDGAAYNVGAEIYGCWIHDEPPSAVRIDRIEPTVGKIIPGDGRSLVFGFWRLAGTTHPSGGQLMLHTRKDIFVMLFEIIFTSSAIGSDVCKNEPIWLTWTPEMTKVLNDSKHSEVQIARPAIDKIRQLS